MVSLVAGVMAGEPDRWMGVAWMAARRRLLARLKGAVELPAVPAAGAAV